MWGLQSPLLAVKAQTVTNVLPSGWGGGEYNRLRLNSRAVLTDGLNSPATILVAALLERGV